MSLRVIAGDDTENTGRRAVGPVGAAQRVGDPRAEMKIGPPVVEAPILQRHHQHDEVEPTLRDPRDRVDPPSRDEVARAASA